MSQTNWNDFAPVDDKGAQQPKATPESVNWSDFAPADETPSRGFGGWARDIGATAVKGAIGVPEAAVGLADLATGGRVGKFLENEGGAVGFRPKQAKEIANEWHSDATKEAQRKFQEADGIVDKAATAIQNPSLIATAVGESLPSMGAGGVAARGLMAATRLGQMGAKGAALAGAAGEGIAGAGAAAEQIRQETDDGLFTPGQAAAAAGTGVATAGFGALGGKIANRLGIGDAETMLAQGNQGIAKQFADDASRAATNPLVQQQAVKSIPRQVIEGAVAEGFLEELPQSVAEQVFQNLALDKPWYEDVDAAVVMGTLSGAAMGGAAAGYRGFREPSAPEQQPVQPGQPPQQDQQPPAPNPGLDMVRQSYEAQLQALREQEQGEPIVAQTAPPDGAAALAQQRAQAEAERQAAIESSRAVVSPDDEIYQSTGMDQMTPSQRMGLRSGPESGALESAAALAVDAGATAQLQQAAAQAQAQAQATEAAKKVKPAKKKTAQAAEVDPQTGEIASGMAAWSDADLSTAFRGAQSRDVRLQLAKELQRRRAARAETTSASGTEDAGTTQAITAATTGAMTDGPQAAQAQQAIAQPAQAGNPTPAAGAADTAAAATAPAGGSSLQAAGLTDGRATTEDAGAQSTTAASAQGPTAGEDREQRAQRTREAGAQWTRLTAVERQAAIARAQGIKPVLAKNLPRARWEDLHVDVQRKLADAMAPQAAPATASIKGELGDGVGTYAEKLNARLDDAKHKLMQARGTAPGLRKLNGYDLSALEGEVSRLESMREEAKALDDAALRESIDRGMLKSARQELDATSLTPDQRAQVVQRAGSTGNAVDASRAIFDAVDGGAVTAAANEAATSPQNDHPEPTDAQKEAGNYRKGHVRLNGHEIAIENPAGSKRRPEWPALQNHYGYIKGSMGADKDHVDLFMTDRAHEPDLPVFVVDQVNQDGSFDEHKVVMGAANEAEARRTYLGNYAKGWTGLGAITQMTQDEFKAWVRDAAKTKKPAGKLARPAAAQAAPKASAPPAATEADPFANNKLFTADKVAAVDEARRAGATNEEIAQAPGVVNVPPAIAAALDADMQAQKARITRLRNAATAEGMSLEEKKQAQTRLKGAEFVLQKMRTTRFDAEDAAIKAIEQNDMAPFAEHIAFPRMEKALQELIAKSSKPDVAQAPEATKTVAETPKPLFSDPRTGMPIVVPNKATADAMARSKQLAGKAVVRKATPAELADQRNTFVGYNPGEDRRMGYVLEVPQQEAPPAKETTHNGTRIYPSKVKVGDPMFSFAGQQAATADRHALASAQKRLAAGEDPDAVRQDTGWFKGADGKWRFEINDAGAKLRPALKSLDGGGYDAKQIASVTYRKREDGTYDVTLNPPSPKRTSDFVTLTGISRGAMRAVLPDSAVAAVDRNEGDEDLIGDFEEAKRINVSFEFGGFNALPLDNVIDHPALFAAYPALRNVMVQVDPKLGIGGSFSYVDHNDGTTSKVIRLGGARQLSTLLHEIQHGIQNIEGFATGGNQDSRADVMQAVSQQRSLWADVYAVRRELDAGKKLDAVLEEWQEFLDAQPSAEALRIAQDPELETSVALQNMETLERQYAQLRNEGRGDTYRRLAGEVEARNTQARQGMTDEQRRATPPSQTADVADSDVIVMFNGKEMQDAPAPANAEQRQDATPDKTRADSNARLVAAQMLVDGLKANWTRAPEIIVARNMQDPKVPQAVRDYDQTLKSQGASGEPRGFIYKGKVYLLSDQLNGAQDVAEALFHEVLGHYGLRGAFGDGLTPILQQIGTMRRADVVAKAREYGLFDKDALGVDPKQASNRQIWDAMTAQQRLEAAEEVLAEMAQTQPNIGFVQRAIAAIRNWLRSNVPGFKNLRLTDADIIQAYILPARGWVERRMDNPARLPAQGVVAPAYSRSESTQAGYEARTDRAVMDMVREGRGARDILRLIAGTSKSRFNRQVARLLLKTGIDPQVLLAHGAMGGKDGFTFLAKYSRKNNAISLTEGAQAQAEQIVLHEMVHAATLAALDRKGLHSLQMRRLFEHVKRRGGAAGQYGMKNVGEFVAEVFTNPEFQRALKAMDAPAGGTIRNAWDGFVRILRSILGLPKSEHSALSRALELGVAVMREDMQLRQRGVVARGGDAQAGIDQTQTEAIPLSPEQIKSATGNRGTFDPEDDRINFSRAGMADDVAKRVGAAVKSVTVTNIKQRAGFKLTDYLGIGLQALGRRQIVDIYGDLVPLAEYNRLVQQMEADKNEGGAEADQLVTRWAELQDEAKLADLMHEATLAQIDPAKPYVGGDDKAKYAMLAGRFNALSQAAKQVYTDTRDAYQAHHAKVRSAIKERIERSEIKGERKAALLKQMDDEFFKAIKGVYFPLARFGQYAVTVKGPDGKVESVSRAETKAEAEALRNNLLSAFPRDKGFTVGRVMLSKDFIADRDAVGRGFMTELYQVLDQQNMDAAQRAELEDTLGQLYLSSLPDLSWAKHGIHRKGTPGFSQDARRAFAQNMFHGARYLAKLRYSDLMQDELAAMQKHVDDWREVEDFDQNSAQRVVDEMNKRHESLMNPKSNPLSTALTSLGFVFHLGLSPASAMVNLSQTALVAYPIMGAKWGFGKASAALLKASAEAAKGKNDITASLNADERAAYDEAVRAGTIDVTMAHDLAGIAQGEDAGVMWKIRPVMRWASFMFHHAERFNRQVTFVAAYRLAREAGADQKAAFEQATKATYDGHYDYSAANRPRIMQGNVAKVLLLFKQYGQNMVYTLARNAQQSIKGESPEVRAQARKALGGLLATHAAAAGVLGLPMVTTLLAAASMIGGDDDEPWDAKVALQNMLADTFGQKPAEVLAHGLSRLTPWDISGRVGLDRLIFPDVQEGLEGQRLWESAATQALGPVGGIFGGLLKGLDLMSDGHYQLGLEAMLPAVLRQGVKSIRYATEGAQDKTGVVIKDEVSMPAVVGQLLGFSPSEVRLAQEGKSAIYQQDKALGERRQELLTKAARATMAKDAEARAEAMKEIQRFNQKNPTRRITPLNVLQSVRNRQKRIDRAEGGVYLPRNRRDAMDAGRFANAD